MGEEERKCDFYLVRKGDWQNNVAVRTYNNNNKMQGFCITSPCLLGGDMPDGEKKYAVNNKTVIPFRCWLGML